MARPMGVPQVASSPTQQQGCNCGGAGMKPSPTTPAGQPPQGTTMGQIAGAVLPSYAPNPRTSFSNGSMQVARPQPTPTLFGGNQSPQMDSLWSEVTRRMF